MRLLLDENLEHEVYHRLGNYGHDVLHIEVSDGLVKGFTDPEIAAVSLDESRTIVTYDDDFRTGLGAADYHAVLFLEDESLSAREVADIVHEVSRYHDGDHLSGFINVGRSWLD
jgi:predicted nuclease of predicted toxin-antitoxin system